MIKLVFDKENKRSIAYDENVKIGECNFIEIGDVWNINHTEVDNQYRGQGVARKLVEIVIVNAKIYNKNLMADCSYAKKII